PSQSSEVYAADGTLISERKGEKDAEYVYYEDIPKAFVTAMISIEDKKFYSHNGVDFKAVVRAATAMVKAKLNKSTATQGASTITMQLAKLMYLDADQTWQYKVKQMFIAMELEKRYSKEKIMEFYLNNIYFSNGYYGIEAACHGYFNCELGDLDLSQICFLCAIPNSPTYYDPLTNFDHTIERRDRILENLLDDQKITQEAYYEAKSEEIVLNRPQSTGETLMNNYVDTYTYYCATRALMELDGFEFQYYFDTDEEEEEYDTQYDELYTACQKKLYAGGYKIYTSIELDKQDALQESIDDVLSGFTDLQDDGIYKMQGAAVCIDNDTGYVVAIVGGREQSYYTYTLNRAYQSHRQPGSSIKPLIVYTPSLERGYTPDSIVEDVELEDGPANANGVYEGEVTLRYAVAKSLNTVAWQLYEDLTPEVGLSYLKAMNFTSIVDEDYVTATALGGFTKGVSALEMAAGFATIENDGMYRQPTCILRIVDKDENVVYASEQEDVIIYDKTAARMMTDILTSVMDYGTGKSLALTDMPCAGKTGTTNDYKDGWFVGYTRYYTTSVWVGCDYPEKISGLTGSSYPGQIWQSYMNTIHEGLDPIDFLPYAQLSDDFGQQEETEEETPEEEEQPEEEEPEQEEPAEAEEPEQQEEEEPAEEEQPEEEPQEQEEGEGQQEEGEQPEENEEEQEEGGDNADADENAEEEQ
ncbi:MAG: transglycosylase domain-containing protein, partial [Clostridiales bacterium]|nr:transglycosylase domain-containing protein [Clostridiales bacterium]